MRKTFATLAMVAALVLTGCGDDGGTGLDGDELSEDEAVALASAVLDLALGEGLEAAFSSFGPARAPIDIDQTVSLTPACPEGGSVELSMDFDGTVDPETGDVDVSFDLTQTHQSCGVSADGHSFVLDGDPNITMSYDVSGNSGGNFDLDGSYSGGIEWELDGSRSGSCSINVTFSGNQSGGEVSGSVCGVSFSGNVTG